MPYGVTDLDHHWFKEWPVACPVPSLHLNQCWIIYNCATRSKHWEIAKCSTIVFVQENAEWWHVCSEVKVVINYFLYLRNYLVVFIIIAFWFFLHLSLSARLKVFFDCNRTTYAVTYLSCMQNSTNIEDSMNVSRSLIIGRACNSSFWKELRFIEIALRQYQLPIPKSALQLFWLILYSQHSTCLFLKVLSFCPVQSPGNSLNWH